MKETLFSCPGTPRTCVGRGNRRADECSSRCDPKRGTSEAALSTVLGLGPPAGTNCHLPGKENRPLQIASELRGFDGSVALSSNVSDDVCKNLTFRETQRHIHALGDPKFCSEFGCVSPSPPYTWTQLRGLMMERQ